MFPAPPGPFDNLAGQRLPDFRRKIQPDAGQLLAIVGSLLLLAGTVGVPFCKGQTLWELGLADGVPADALFVVILSLVSIILAILRLHWGLWITGFAANVSFACAFLFIYYPLVAPPIVVAAPPIAAGPVVAAQAELLPPPAEEADELLDFPDEVEMVPEPVDVAPPPPPPAVGGRPNLIWRVQHNHGGLFLLAGILFLFLGAGCDAYLDYRKDRESAHA
jgi:hypothetical protein